VPAQFEDFQSKWAFKLLQRYRNTYRMFNDDVQVEFLLYWIITSVVFNRNLSVLLGNFVCDVSE